MKKVILDEQVICKEYTDDKMSILSLATKYKTAPRRIRDILDRNGLGRNPRTTTKYVVEDCHTEKYPAHDGITYIVFDPLTDFVSNDVGNRSGVLTTYISKQYGVTVPSNYDRSQYYRKTGNYWWEQWLNVREEETTIKETRLTRWENLDKTALCLEYANTDISIDALAAKNKIGKKRLQDLFKKYNVKKVSRQNTITDRYNAGEFKKEKYTPIDNKEYIVYDPLTTFESKDINNKGGVLTSYIEQTYGVATPPIYDRRIYYMMTGNYWWEQWLKVKLVEKPKTKKCPYCNWETTDLENKSGMFEVHLLKEHGIGKRDYIQRHPEDKPYFALASKTLHTRLFETDPKHIIHCPICGEPFVRISAKHLKSHGLTRSEFILKYGNCVAPSFHDRMSEVAKEVNRNATFHRVSGSEQEIIDFIRDLGFQTTQDRHILNGLELDIYIPDKNVAFEYDGIYWHNEQYKTKEYHLSKTEVCAEHGIRLIHIFEDEWLTKREIVKSRIRNILNTTPNRIFARKCEIRSVFSGEAKTFLEINHIQGEVNGVYRYGLFYEDELVSLMTFGKMRKALGSVNQDNSYELLRFCNKLNTTVVGGASRLFKHFINEVKPQSVISYADRRWSMGNLYEKLGFSFSHNSRPNYFYIINGERVNRFTLRKDILISKYGCPSDMSEHQFCLSKKWYRIYDCGTACFIWNNKK